MGLNKFLLIGLLLILLTPQIVLAESPNSIKQKISNSLSQDGCCILADKVTITTNGVLKTSYEVKHLLLEETVGVVNVWSDVDGKDVHEIELSTSHFNDSNSEVVAWVLLNVLKKGISDGQIDDDIFFDMADEVDKQGESSIITKNGYKVVLKEIIVVEGTPGLTFLILNIDYNLDTFVSEQTQATIEQPTSFSSESESVVLSENDLPRYGDVDDTPTWVYGLIGFFVLIGIPVIIIWLIIRKIKQRRGKIDLSKSFNR